MSFLLLAQITAALLLLLGLAVFACCFFLCFRLGPWLFHSADRALALREMANPPSPAATHPRSAARPAGRPSAGFPLILALLVSCLIFFGWQRRQTTPIYPPSDQDKALGKLRVRPGEEAVRPSWSVTGRGETREDAELMAFEQAYGHLDSYLRDDLQVHWVPARNYVRAHMVKDLKYEGSRVQADLGRVHEVSLRLEITPQDRKDFVRRDRLLLLSKLLGVTLALLVTVAGYIRLDEYSKGYYNAWLRLGAICVGGAAVAGLWFYIGG